MDVFEETLTHTLMPDGAPESWRESEEFSPYVQHLASCGINKLRNECPQLESEQQSVLEQTKELAYKEYLTFIHSADCSKDMLTQLGSLEERLSGASNSVSSLQQTLGDFVNASRSLLHARQLNSTTLAKHTQLLEILELSQLLDTCVRNNYHDEALEIIAYVRRLEKRHGHIPIIKSIVSEVQLSSQQMLLQLLSQLRTDTSLPQCLKVVGLIRTLDVFTECQLRIKFLHARDAWLCAAMRALPHTDPYQHLAKSVECARVHLFDIVTQYRAIFSDDHTSVGAHNEAVDLQAILQSWILYKVSGIVSMLRRDLSKGSIAGGNLESLLAQCMFFGQSLSRIGADFRGLLPEIFQEAAARQLEKDVRAANHKFDESLSSFSLTDTSPVNTALGLHQSGGGNRPPLSLLEFPPLGHYLNALAAAFNTLRQCCFTALLPLTLDLLTTSLNKVVRSLLELHQLECSGLTAAETASFGRVCGAVHGALLPHINTCLATLYPRHALAPRMGRTPHHLTKIKFGQLDVAAICKPLEPFLASATNKPEDFTSDLEDGNTATEGGTTTTPLEDGNTATEGGATTTTPLEDGNTVSKGGNTAPSKDGNTATAVSNTDSEGGNIAPEGGNNALEETTTRHENTSREAATQNVQEQISNETKFQSSGENNEVKVETSGNINEMTTSLVPEAGNLLMPSEVGQVTDNVPPTVAGTLDKSSISTLASTTGTVNTASYNPSTSDPANVSVEGSRMSPNPSLSAEITQPGMVAPNGQDLPTTLSEINLND